MLLTEAEGLEIGPDIMEDTADRGKGWLLDATPLVRDPVQRKAAKSLRELAQFVALTSSQDS
jgi:hypothetical protein